MLPPPSAISEMSRGQRGGASYHPTTLCLWCFGCEYEKPIAHPGFLLDIPYGRGAFAAAEAHSRVLSAGGGKAIGQAGACSQVLGTGEGDAPVGICGVVSP